MRWALDLGLYVSVATAGLALACGPPTLGSSGDGHGGATSDPADSGAVTTTDSTEATETDSTETGSTETGSTETSSTETGSTEMSSTETSSTEADSDSSTTGEPDECCPLDMPMSVEVSGSTPGGPFQGTHVWYGYHPPCCHSEDYFVFITPTPTPWPGWGDPGLDEGVLITIPGLTWTPMQWLGEGPATFQAGDHVTEAMITIDAIDTFDGLDDAFDCYEGGEDWRMMVASFSVMGEGWDLTGSLIAPQCGAMTYVHPC